MTEYCGIQPQKAERRRKPARAATRAVGALSRALSWVSGCTFLILTATFSFAQDAQVPSGQVVTLSEVLIDEVSAESWLRFRFLAPQIARNGGDIAYATAENDIAHLCETVARPYLREFDLMPDVVVIFIEAFRISDDTCNWEAF